MASVAQAVTVSLDDLKKGLPRPVIATPLSFKEGETNASPCTHNLGSVPFSALQQAFGPESLGILVVKDVPAEFADLRRRALSYSSYLGNLPKDELGELMDGGADDEWPRGEAVSMHSARLRQRQYSSTVACIISSSHNTQTSSRTRRQSTSLAGL